MTDYTEDHKDFMQPLARGLAIISSFNRGRSSMTLSEAAAAAGMNVAAARRCLITLEALGYVEQRDRRFSLLPKVMDLGFAFMSALPLPDIARPYMQEVVDELGEACYLGVLAGPYVLYAAELEPIGGRRHPVAVMAGSGGRMPAHTSSLGRVLLADPDNKVNPTEVPLEPFTPHTITDERALKRELDRVRKSGYSLLDQEMVLGLRAIAVPVRRMNTGRAVAALGIITSTQHATMDRLEHEYLPVLAGASRKIGDVLGMRT